MNQYDDRAHKDDVFGHLARVPRALASPRRLELVDLLAQAERNVEELAALTGMSVANTSQHLQVLRAAALVTVRRAGPRAHYSLAHEAVFRVWQAVRELGRERLAELDRVGRGRVAETDRVGRTRRAAREPVEAVSAEELLRRMRRREVVVLDVRPTAEYRAGHIAGARSIPVRELRRRLEELPKGREIVAYCRGPFCVYADEAAALLRRRGFRARRLDTGFPDWKAAALPVDVD